MPRLAHRPPSYCKHRASGQAVVTIDGKDIYLGPHGTKVSKLEYDRVIAEWLAAGRRLPCASATLTVAQLLLAFLKHATTYYRQPVFKADGSVARDADGRELSKPAPEFENFKRALRPVADLYAHTPAREFGPLALKAVRERLITFGWCRQSVNRSVSRIRQVFKWAVENELVPADAYHGLQAVSGIRIGRSEAPETIPVTPVPDACVQATFPFLSSQVKAMVELQLLTGMRPGEVCSMRTRDIDTTGQLWSYQPLHHKTAHHGHQRRIYFGPKAIGILKPFLKTDLTACVFSPADAEQERLQKLHAQRKTPLSYGNVPGSNCKKNPKRHPGIQYTVSSYRRAIARACDRAFALPPELKEPTTKGARKAEAEFTAEEQVKRKQQRLEGRRAWRKEHIWHPHQLRHNAATELRKRYGLEAAQVILGHKTLAVTEIYAEKNIEAARKIMAEIG